MRHCPTWREIGRVGQRLIVSSNFRPVIGSRFCFTGTKRRGEIKLDHQLEFWWRNSESQIETSDELERPGGEKSRILSGSAEYGLTSIWRNEPVIDNYQPLHPNPWRKTHCCFTDPEIRLGGYLVHQAVHHLRFSLFQPRNSSVGYPLRRMAPERHL